MLSHHEQNKDNSNTAFLNVPTISKAHFSFNNVVSNKNLYKLPNNFVNISVRSECEDLNSFSAFDQNSVPQFVDFKFNKLYNHIIKSIYLFVKFSSSALTNSSLLPLSHMISKIEISRSNSEILQTILSHDIYHFHKLNWNVNNSDVSANIINSSSLIANGTIKNYIELPTIFNGTYLSKFKGDDIFLRVYFRQRDSKLVTSTSVNQDNTKISLSECKIFFDLNEVDSSVAKSIDSNSFIDYVQCIPETYNFYSGNMQANTNYDLQVSQIYKNTCAGFTTWILGNTGNAEDVYNYIKPNALQIKSINNQEESVAYDDLLVKVMNKHKIPDNMSLGESNEMSWFFDCNNVNETMKGNYIDGFRNYKSTELKYVINFPSASNSIFITFLTYKLVRISDDSVKVLLS